MTKEILKDHHNDKTEMKLSISAIVAGVGLLLLVIFAPYAELFVFQNL